MSKRKRKEKRIPGFVYEPVVKNHQKSLKIQDQKKLAQNLTLPVTENKQELSENLIPSSPIPTSPVTKKVRNPSPKKVTTSTVPTQNVQNDHGKEEDLDVLLNKIYKYKESPAAYSASVQKYIDQNYSLSIHKQRRKKFK